MECHCIPAAELPHSSKLFRDFLGSFGRVAKFYAHPPSLEETLKAACKVQLDTAGRRSVVEVLREQNRRFGCDTSVERNLERLAAGAVAVVTGQQVGLFGGPAYSVYKALSAVALARQLTQRGTEAVPVFWMATEDHDLAEVNHSDWLDADQRLRRITLAVPGAEGRRVGEVELGEGLAEAVESAVDALHGPHATHIEAILRHAYAPGETFGSAFARLMARLLAGRGLILLDPLDARLHRLAAPIYRRALEDHTALSRELLARGKALEKTRYHSQVKVAERNTLLFLNVAGRRHPLRAANGGFRAGSASFPQSEILSTLETAPESFTPNALLRPVVQDALLPTAACVAGPAEIAYFAQAEVLYRRLLGRMPAIVHRAGFTLVEPRVATLLKKYGLEVRDLWRGRQHLRKRMERLHLPAALSRQFTEGEKSLEHLLRRLRRPLGTLDKTLVGALATAERKMLFQFLKLRGKAGRAQNFRTGVLDRHERALVDALYPHHAPQERTLGLLGFLAGHGMELLDQLESRSADAGSTHHVVFL